MLLVEVNRRPNSQEKAKGDEQTACRKGKDRVEITDAQEVIKQRSEKGEAESDKHNTKVMENTLQKIGRLHRLSFTPPPAPRHPFAASARR